MRERTAAVLVAGLVLTAGCQKTETRAAPVAPSRSSTPAVPSRTHHALRVGAHGAEVRELQRRLKELHYDPGTIDGRYGQAAVGAVWAFQKVNRLKPSSTVGRRTWSALDSPRTPAPLKKGPADRVEIDLNRQLLYAYRDGRLALITHISSGSGETFCSQGRCRVAGTSTGDFHTGRRAHGWETGPLGSLYNPIYFNGGIAIHGAPDVPLHPASHGCVRIPIQTAEILPTLTTTNEPIYVRRPH